MTWNKILETVTEPSFEKLLYRLDFFFPFGAGALLLNYSLNPHLRGCCCIEKHRHEQLRIQKGVRNVDSECEEIGGILYLFHLFVFMYAEE